MMLKVTFSHTSMEQCRGSCNQTRSPELQTECKFFLIAVRLASLNQILDPWVYLLLRKILLRKFCQVANAICHSKDGWKGRHIMLSDKIRHTTAWINLHVNCFPHFIMHLAVPPGIQGMPISCVNKLQETLYILSGLNWQITVFTLLEIFKL